MYYQRLSHQMALLYMCCICFANIVSATINYIPLHEFHLYQMTQFKLEAVLLGFL